FNMLVDFTAIDWSKAASQPKTAVTPTGSVGGAVFVAPGTVGKGPMYPERSGEEGLVPARAGDGIGARFEVVYRLLALDAAQGLVGGRAQVRAELAEGETVPRSV